LDTTDLGRNFFISIRTEKNGLKTFRGCIAASPKVKILPNAYLFFFFFFGILFSSKFLESPASIADGARLQFSCIVTALYLVKKKVRKKLAKKVARA
jgi:hypothetical protein